MSLRRLSGAFRALILPAEPVKTDQAVYDELEGALDALSCDTEVSFADWLFSHFAIGYFIEEGVCGFGAYHRQFAERLSGNTHTCTISPRGSLKSTVLRALVGYFLWRLPTLRRNIEIAYMSYTQDFAGRHCAKAKRYIEANPLYARRGIRSLTDAATVLRYLDRKSGKTLTCIPVGVLSFKRGLHTDILLGDDVLTDPQASKRMDIAQIVKVTKIFMEQAYKIPKPVGGQLHVVGTPQDETDLLHVLRTRPEFDWAEYPAVDEGARLLWPEVLSTARLQQDLETMGRNAFTKEMLVRPARSVDSFFRRDDFDGLIGDPGRVPSGAMALFGGWDLGKKRHPSHISILGQRADKSKWQVRTIWLDHWDYTAQVDLIRKLIQTKHIKAIAYDATRGELEGMAERKELPRQLIPITMTKGVKAQLALDFDVEVTNLRLHLLNEEDENGYDRQLEQILAVDNDLEAVETSKGHGDSFWSNALAILAANTAGRGRSFVAAYLRQGDRVRPGM